MSRVFCDISKLFGLQFFFFHISKEQYFLSLDMLRAREIWSPGSGTLTEMNGDDKNVCLHPTASVGECVFCRFVFL